MKHFIPLLIVCGISFLLIACTKIPQVEADLGFSSIYTEKDMNDAISKILAEFNSWEDVEMKNIRYAGDECNSKENIEWMNQLDPGRNYTQCISFKTDFHTSKNAKVAWKPDHDYTNYEWYLGRNEGGEWKLLTWGY